MLFGSPKTSTGTYLPVPQAEIDQAFKTHLTLLCKAYLALRAEGRGEDRSALKSAIADFNGAMASKGITQEAVLECYRAFHQSGVLRVETFQLVGWLLIECFPHSGEDIFAEFGLMPDHQPYPSKVVKPVAPEYGASPWTNTAIPSSPPPRETPPPAPTPEREPVSLRGEIAITPDGYKEFVQHVPVDTFVGQMGLPTANMLLVEDRVSGEPAINNFIHAVFSQGQEMKRLANIAESGSMPEIASQCPSKGPEFIILDVTGSLYLGFKHVPGVVYHPDTVAPSRPLLNGQAPPAKLDYPAEVWEMVPLLEGAYQAYKVIKDRLRERRKTAQGKPYPVFHRYVLIIRWWNVILMQWNKLGKPGQDSVRKLWEEVYPRTQEITLDLVDVVLNFANLGDLVECQIVLTTKTISSVKQLGLTEDDIGSFMFLVPGDAGAKSGFGFSAINRILKDGRWDFNKFPDAGATLPEQEKRLRKLLDLGMSYATATGHQIIFVGGQSPIIMPLAAYHEQDGDTIIRMEEIDSASIKTNYEHRAPAFAL